MQLTHNLRYRRQYVDSDGGTYEGVWPRALTSFPCLPVCFTWRIMDEITGAHETDSTALGERRPPWLQRAGHELARGDTFILPENNSHHIKITV